MDFKQRLKSRMLELNIKQVDIVKNTGASKTSVSRWLHGSIPRGEALTKLASCLKVSPDWLMGRTELSSSFNFQWAGPGDCPSGVKVPDILIIPHAAIHDGVNWDFTGEVSALSRNIKSLSFNGEKVVLIDNTVFNGLKGSYAIVDTGIRGTCANVEFKAMKGDTYIVNWHGQILVLDITLTAAGDLRVTSSTGQFKDEMIFRSDIDRVEVMILGRIMLRTQDSD